MTTDEIARFLRTHPKFFDQHPELLESIHVPHPYGGRAIPLSERQAIQFWVAEAATKIHATRLMTYDCAWKLDQGRDVRNEISMIKWYATEMAYETVDRAMQAFGAMGMTKELPLALMQAKLRTMRIYDGPTEVHKWVVARNLLGTRK